MVVSAQEMSSAAHNGAAGASLEAAKAQSEAAVVAVKPPGGEVSKGVKVQLDDEYKSKRRRHLVIPAALSQEYLLSLLPIIKENFAPQKVVYNGGVEWANSCYMDVEQKMKPATMPHLPLLSACSPMLLECDRIFTDWYTAHHGAGSVRTLTRLQSFVTRYRPQPGENQLARHVDGRNVHGSVILGLPTDDMFTGGGVTCWDGYAINPGDICMLDRCVWHQGNPIFSGTRWVVVIFYAVQGDSLSRADSRSRGVHKVNAASLLQSFEWIDKTGTHGMQLQVIAHPLDEETKQKLHSKRGEEGKRSEAQAGSKEEQAATAAVAAAAAAGEGGAAAKGQRREEVAIPHASGGGGGAAAAAEKGGGGGALWTVMGGVTVCAIGGLLLLRSSR